MILRLYLPDDGRQLHNLSYCFNTLHVRRRVFYSVGVKAFFSSTHPTKKKTQGVTLMSSLVVFERLYVNNSRRIVSTDQEA